LSTPFKHLTSVSTTSTTRVWAELWRSASQTRGSPTTPGVDDRRSPDYARTVDIHRKPGYDPVEPFLEPALWLPKLKIGLTLLRIQLGFRTLLDLLPLDATLVRGAHARITMLASESPVVATRRRTR